MLLGMFGNDHSLQLGRGPDVSCRAHIDGVIKRAALDAECCIARRVAMPDTRAAVGAKVAIERAAAVGGTGPALGAPARQGKGLGSDDQGNAERGGRLFAALGAVANVNPETVQEVRSAPRRTGSPPFVRSYARCRSWRCSSIRLAHRFAAIGLAPLGRVGVGDNRKYSLRGSPDRGWGDERPCAARCLEGQRRHARRWGP